MIKSRKMKSIIFCLVTTLMLSMALTACGNKKESSEKPDETVESQTDAQQESSGSSIDLSDIKIDYKTSELYSKEDMDAAIKLIVEEFNTWEGCTLYDISYTDDQNCTDNLSHINELSDDKQYDECIIFVSNFHSPKEGGGAWEPDYDYENWMWLLGRVKGENWDLLDWGY